MIGNSCHMNIIKRCLALLGLSACFILSGSALAAGDEDAAPEAEYAKSSKMCLACHGEGRTKPAHEILLGRMGTTANPASPMAEGNHGCQACHGPSKAHTKKSKDGGRPSPAITFGPEVPADVKNGACLACHDNGSRFHWMGMTCHM